MKVEWTNKFTPQSLKVGDNIFMIYQIKNEEEVKVYPVKLSSGLMSKRYGILSLKIVDITIEKTINGKFEIICNDNNNSGATFKLDRHDEFFYTRGVALEHLALKESNKDQNTKQQQTDWKGIFDSIQPEDFETEKMMDNVKVFCEALADVFDALKKE